MRAAFVSFCVALLTASAAAQTQATFGPFHPPMSVEDAMAAAPDLAWDVQRSRQNNNVIGAETTGLTFMGATWDVKIGEELDVRPYGNTFSFDIRRVADTRNARACRDALSEIVTQLEPMYGRFGQHPSFNGRGVLYGSPWGPCRIVEVGGSSVARHYYEDSQVVQFTTFNEVDEQLGRAVMVGATYYDEMHQCELRIHDFEDHGRPARAAQARVSSAR